MQQAKPEETLESILGVYNMSNLYQELNIEYLNYKYAPINESTIRREEISKDGIIKSSIQDVLEIKTPTKENKVYQNLKIKIKADYINNRLQILKVEKYNEDNVCLSNNKKSYFLIIKKVLVDTLKSVSQSKEVKMIDAKIVPYQHLELFVDELYDADKYIDTIQFKYTKETLGVSEEKDAIVTWSLSNTPVTVFDKYVELLLKLNTNEEASKQIVERLKDELQKENV